MSGCPEEVRTPTTSAKAVRVAMIGCGSVAEIHVLALEAVEGAVVTALFDSNRDRARRFRRQWCPSAHEVGSLREAAELADLAIVATPNAAHEEATCELLERGVEVLCEKPLAISVRAASRMIETASGRGRLLACGHVRRFFPQTELLHEILDSGLLGRMKSIRVWERVKWPWTAASFERAVSGGGVLIDTGPHVIDLMLHILGPLQLTEYTDDSSGGVEAYARVRLTCAAKGGPVPVEMLLSRGEWGTSLTRIECERGGVSLEPQEVDSIRLTLLGRRGPIDSVVRRPGPNPYVAQLKNVIGAINARESLRVPTADALDTVRFLSSCYEARGTFIPGWRDASDIGVDVGWPRQRVLLTGSTGSIGSRLIEMWAEAGRIDQLRCLVRSYAHAPRLKRYLVEVIEGDLTDPSVIRRAIQGCDAIVHLGAGEVPSLETRYLAREALARGVHRFVHMSTAVVYGLGLPGTIEAQQEETPLSKTGELYADGKADAERLLQRYAQRGLHTVVLRPQVVYGPEMRWSGELMHLLAQGELAVVSGGGVCNLVYVDDLVRAIGLALVKECRPGARFFISDGQPRTWAEYIDAHARLAGVDAPRTTAPGSEGSGTTGAWRQTARLLVPVLASKEFRTLATESPVFRASVFPAYLALRRRVGVIASLAATIRRVRLRSMGGRERFNPHWTRLQLSQARLSIRRAEQELGYKPRFGFDEGLRRTALWFAAVGLTDGGRPGAESEPTEGPA